jgi:membrane protein DedA with SNARE-associated domain
MEPHELSALLGSWGYPALFALFLATGVGSPVPEDVLLVGTGYLISAGVLAWPAASAVAWLGVIASDLILFVAGRRLAWHISGRSADGFFSPARMQHATRWFDARGDVLVLLARLVPGTRAVVFVTAGVRAMRGQTFLKYDAVGALLWVPAMLWVGHLTERRFGDPAALAEYVSAAAWTPVVAIVVLICWLTLGREAAKL